jgi:RNase P subunit RPR2
MDAKFAVNLAEYATFTVRCPVCNKKYLLKLRRDTSLIAQNSDHEILVTCLECVKAKRLNKKEGEF